MIKPSGSASPAEPVDVTQLNSNADVIDKFLGCILVNDGVTPATGDLFDGAIVKEKTSGIVWEARKNGGGTFDKVYLSYPYHYSAYGPPSAFASGAYAAWGWDTVDTSILKNASAAQKQAVTNFWVCPVKGLYTVTMHVQFAVNGTGWRGLVMTVNGTVLNSNTEVVVPAVVSGTFTSNVQTSLNRPFNVNDVLGAMAFQDSGGNLTILPVLKVTMIDPIQ
jgi:hypothetical protein